METRVPVLTAVALLASLSPGASEARRLNTEELNVLIVGTTMDRGDPPKSYPRPDLAEQFRSDGTYVRFDDNYQAYGTYTIRDDQICVKAEMEKQLCRSITVDRQGRYWITEPGWSFPSRWVKFIRR